MRSVVVVGGSLAGHRAAHALRERGYDGRLTVIGAEPHRPYDRYPLSKAFLTGAKDRHGLDLAGDPADVVWRLGETVTGLDLAGRFVTVDGGDRIPFDGLVVASGARPRDASAVTGVLGAFVFRTVEDATDLRAALSGGARRVVVVGGGLIGAELAATAVADGHDTTLLDSSDVPTRRALGLTVAEHLLGLHRQAGVEVRLRTRARGLDVRGGVVTGVLLVDGTRLAADIVVMATGTTPNVEWLADSRLGVSGGLGCGPTLHALGSDIVVGAGDVVRAPHPLLDGESARVEHWASTLDHANLAAANLLAGLEAAQPLTSLPGFGTTIHGARIRSVGFPQVADRSRVVWGSLESGEAVVVLGRGDRAVAATSVNATARLPLVAKQLAPGVLLDEVRLEEPTTSSRRADVPSASV
jgi:NADPH-dependent 2,4-dienoyl-CoA reductase/sulfur reductase-like enzyme